MKFGTETAFLSGMAKRTLSYFLLISLVALPGLARAQLGAPNCHSVHRVQQLKALPVDLPAYNRAEIQNLSPDQIARLNEDTLQEIKAFVPIPQGGRAQVVSVEQATKLLQVVRNHPVVSSKYTPRYQPANTEIGYCFGRAAYLHLMLLKIGLDKESVKKIWALGPMKVPGTDITWGFHVATLAFSRESGWVVLDSNFSEPFPVQKWMKAHSSLSIDQKLRFYITDANKFGLNLGKYDRIQMGLDLPKEQDWYQHYFVDMLKSIRETSLAELGLVKYPRAARLASQRSPPAEAPSQEARDRGFLDYLKRALGI